MASLFCDPPSDIGLLDPGAGTGILTAAFIEDMTARGSGPDSISIMAHEVEPSMARHLAATFHECALAGDALDTSITTEVCVTDFIEWGVSMVCERDSLLGGESPAFTHCIMNPPYKKIRGDSSHRAWLQQIGIETGNLYSAFLSLATELLSPGGELVAIVPRSFCNGPYFRPFRNLFLSQMALRHLHVFDSRRHTFKEDGVLQENIILSAVKGRPQKSVTITSSSGPQFEAMTERVVPFSDVVKPTDPDRTIHIATSGLDQMVVDRISVFTHLLADLGLDVCTGPVVDFRMRQDIRRSPDESTHPLIYAERFRKNFVEWPKLGGKKPNAIAESERSARWLMPNGWYVLTKRFSAKEEERRIVAALHTPDRVPGKKIGFENHLNVIHCGKAGLHPDVAKGLAVFLNSTLQDVYFRQFSGHTQVNATDLRAMRYPDLETLRRLGQHVTDEFPSQDEVDRLLDREIDSMAKSRRNPLIIRKRIEDAQAILDALQLPKAQRNERSALTLLALLNLLPGDDWTTASEPFIGITPIMDFIRDNYRKEYAPNTRETIRRETIHQFVEAGIAVLNPDKPERPVNSPKSCYQITPEALDLIRSFSSDEWESKLTAFLRNCGALAESYAKERDMRMIPLRVNGKHDLVLTPGKHSELIRDIVTEFGPRYAADAEVLYVGDTGSKMGYFEEDVFAELGLTFDSHGKFPDVVLYQRSKNWLLLIESVTSHGPVNAKRHSELDAMFAQSTAGVVYVTAFPDRQTMAKYVGDISWETEVWIADAPSHLIHFDGERFLGPY